MYTHEIKVKRTLADQSMVGKGVVLAVGEHVCEECGTVFPRCTTDVYTVLCQPCWEEKYGKK
jgi:hypothetical protein